MNPYIHQLSTQSHRTFLEEERKDPITGDRIQAGDAVVICAGCKSAFLEGSWAYLGGQHCGQQETLVQIPEKLKLTLTKRIEKLLFSAETHSGNLTWLAAVPTGIISAILLFLSVAKVLPIMFLGLIPVLMMIPFLVHVFSTEGVEAKETAFFIKKGFGRRIKIPIKDITRIELAFFTNLKFEQAHPKRIAGKEYKQMYEEYFSTHPILRIVSNKYSSHEINLSEYDFNKNRSEIIRFFEKLSHILPISLHSNNTTLIEEFEKHIPKSKIVRDEAGVHAFGLYLAGTMGLKS